VLTVEEQLSGWQKELRRAKDRIRLAEINGRMTRTTAFLGRLQILSFIEPAILRWENLKRLKLNIGKTDLRIAAIALEQNAVVVTRNSADFGRVPGPTIEDWSR
jgi:tRNA(fMet)-specific endonuclease VapC